jgi:hypothetical protein
LVLVTAAGLYSSFLYVLVVATQALVMLTKPRQELIYNWAAFGVGGLLFVPWLPFFKEQLAVGGALRQTLPGWESVVSLTQAKALFITFGKFILGTQDLDLLSIQTVAISIFFLLFAIALWSIRERFRERLSPLVMFTVWCVVPIFAAWIISFWIPILQPKRVLFCLPALYLLVATCFEYTQLKLRWALLGLVLVFNVWGMSSLYTNPLVQREDWRSLHAELLRDYPADSAVAVFSFPEPFAPWRWYDDGSYPTLTTGTLHINQSDLRTALKRIPEYRYVIIFDYLRDLTDPDDLLIEAVTSYGYQEREVRSRPLIGQVRIFSKPSSILSSSHSL